MMVEAHELIRYLTIAIAAVAVVVCIVDLDDFDVWTIDKEKDDEE